MCRLDVVTKPYRGPLAVKDITLAIRPGQTTVLIGPSGCGKSTLFGLMTGLFRPDSGIVHFEDNFLKSSNINAIRIRVGYGIQYSGWFTHLAGRNNICIMAEYFKWTSVRITQRAADLITVTGLATEMLKRYGQPILTGIRFADNALILLGAVPAATLALIVQGGFGAIERFTLSRGLRLKVRS